MFGLFNFNSSNTSSDHKAYKLLYFSRGFYNENISLRYHFCGS